MSPARRDRAAIVPLSFVAFVCAAIVVLIVSFLVGESRSILQSGGLLQFFSDTGWHPAAEAADGQFNLWPMALGTLLAALGAIALAAPLGLLSAVFCQEHAPRLLAATLRRVLELLAGIPSVVFGLWGLVVLVPLIRELAPPGPSLLAAILILALMILPTVAVLAESALAAVPRELRQAAAALGMSRARCLWGVIIPAAVPGIRGAVLLATGRAIGETLAVLMVCGNVVQTPESLFAPIRTLTANIALEMAYATDDHRSALFFSGLLLAVMVALLVLLAGRKGGQVPAHV